MIQNPLQIKEKIFSTLQRRGPSLPVHIARETGLSILFASAFLSELISEKRIKMSDMRVGSSPIYFISGQERLLENYSRHLKSKEKEAFLLIKEKRFLKDSEQEPAIRVALRAIKDFAIPFRKSDTEEIFWRYFLIPQEEFYIPEPKIRRQINPEPKKREEKSKAKPKSKKKEKSEFILELLDFLKKKDIEVTEERVVKKKEFTGVGRIDTLLGKIKMLVIAKDKKKITEDDLGVSVQKGQIEKKIVLFASSGELSKKAEEFLQEYENIIFLKFGDRKP